MPGTRGRDHIPSIHGIGSALLGSGGRDAIPSYGGGGRNLGTKRNGMAIPQTMNHQTNVIGAAEDVMGVLCRHRIDAVIIGAVALAAHNYVRQTDDMDSMS